MAQLLLSQWLGEETQGGDVLACAEGAPNTPPSPFLALHTPCWGPFETTQGDFLNNSSSRDPWSPGTVGLGFSLAPCKLVASHHVRCLVFGIQRAGLRPGDMWTILGLPGGECFRGLSLCCGPVGVCSNTKLFGGRMLSEAMGTRIKHLSLCLFAKH